MNSATHKKPTIDKLIDHVIWQTLLKAISSQREAGRSNVAELTLEREAALLAVTPNVTALWAGTRSKGGLQYNQQGRFDRAA